jgi:Xaa-Pro aminopeptidase
MYLQAVQQLRLIKSEAEIEAMRTTCQIGAEAMTEAIRSTSKLLSESQVFATVDYESRMRNADFLAYPPVVAAGDHANTIHYTNNTNDNFDRTDLILVDAGCDYGGYSSDITRTWPLSGRFSTYQKLVYEAVLDVQEQLISSLMDNQRPDQTTVGS